MMGMPSTRKPRRTQNWVLGAVALASFAAGLAQHAPPWAAPVQAAAAPPSLCDGYNGLPTGRGAHAGMVRLKGGRFLMGSNAHYAEETQVHPVTVDGFWIDRHDVTNAQFARFVEATGYVTTAERTPSAEQAAQLPPEMRVPGSAVFVMPEGGQPGRWRFVAGANWRQPEGPGSSIDGKASHPVVQVSHDDASAYARWLGRDLPTEAQWEYAARGGFDGQPYVWGDRFMPQGVPMANTWEGTFPRFNTRADGFLGTSPVGCFAPNGYGLFDMAGNVWQWTRTWYRPSHDGAVELNPSGPPMSASIDPRQSDTAAARVIKGGSHLCAPNYCMRYRPAARQPADPSMGTSHIGFRTVRRDTP